MDEFASFRLSNNSTSRLSACPTIHFASFGLSNNSTSRRSACPTIPRHEPYWTESTTPYDSSRQRNNVTRTVHVKSTPSMIEHWRLSRW